MPLRATLLPGDDSPTVQKRLLQVGVAAEWNGTKEIRSLTRLTTGVVYLAPYPLMSRPEWSDLRVHLARSGRYYVVYGEGMTTREIMRAARDGAHEVVDLGETDDRWREAIRNASAAQELWWQLYGGSGDDGTESLLAGRSSTMKALRDAVSRLGPTDATILLIGESGTGKERVSEALHAASGKKNFVAVNCAAIPKDLIESELFGVEKGAFTGAEKAKPGLVEEADGGTLFLDEIGELDLLLQPKLLRFLETRRARRIGSTREYDCRVRVIAATNRDLEQAIDEQRYRADLYYRLSEVILTLAPLRHRREDIPDLVKLFLRSSSERAGKHFETIEPELITRFQAFDWPGNVRELKQAIDRLTLLYDGPVLRTAWWEQPRTRTPEAPPDNTLWPGTNTGPTPQSGNPPSRKERYVLARNLLEKSGDDLTWVAARLGIHPTTLYRWRKAGKV